MKYLLVFSSLLMAGEAAESEIMAIESEDILAAVWQLPEDQTLANFSGAKLLQVARLKSLQSVNAGSYYGLVNLENTIAPAIMQRYHEAFSIARHCEDRVSYLALERSFHEFVKEMKRSKREHVHVGFPKSFARAIKHAKSPELAEILPPSLRTDLEKMTFQSHFTKSSLLQAQQLHRLIQTDYKVDALNKS
jgi:hypothetical protein